MHDIVIHGKLNYTRDIPPALSYVCFTLYEITSSFIYCFETIWKSKSNRILSDFNLVRICFNTRRNKRTERLAAIWLHYGIPAHKLSADSGKLQTRSDIAVRNAPDACRCCFIIRVSFWWKHAVGMPQAHIVFLSHLAQWALFSPMRVKIGLHCFKVVGIRHKSNFQLHPAMRDTTTGQFHSVDCIHNGICDSEARKRKL